ncbi:MAG: penicillin-binding protein activator [Chromatiales bacterium]|nr:MAG: penicillin-binding protein activator [Chromatiales bacterium]
MSLRKASVKGARRDRKNPQRSTWLTGASLGLLLVIAACAPLQREAEPGAEDPGVREATALAGQGRHDKAAEAYLRLAEGATGPLKERYQIRAARERRLEGQLDAAQAILDSLAEPISEENLLGWAQVAGDIAIARDDPAVALAVIVRAPRTSKPAAAAEIQRIRGEAQFRLGEPLRGTEALLEREVWLSSATAIADNQRLLWSLYQRYGAATDVPITSIQDPVLAGWLKLGRLAADRRSGRAGMALALRNWQQANPQHPANSVLVPELLADLKTAAFLPDRVALLLPLSGRQSLAGAAVRDGFMAGFYHARGEQTPAIRIYDTVQDGVVNAYRRAVIDGAQVVIGPLLKDQVAMLATSSSGLEVPTLALNFLPDDIPAPPGLLQFALAPEDEAAATAERGIAERKLRAIALVPNDDWGRRVLNSFAATYQGLGGVLVDYRMYQPAGRDFSYGLQDVLLIGESRDRMTRLQANLGIELGYEPRRRSDVDLIFMAAPADTGKLLRPQLRFYYAGTIPTYSTSAIYIEGARGNSDLNGIMFPDMPWIIAPDPQAVAARASLARYWPADASRRTRLFAMGFDAFQIASRMTGPGGLTEFNGVTGRLYLARDGRIHRRLMWARIAGGQPVPLDPLPVVETPADTAAAEPAPADTGDAQAE